MQRSKRAEDLLQGTPTVLVHHGELVQEHLNKEHISPDEVFTEMRKAGLERLEQVCWAVLEGDGQVSIVPEDEGRAGRRKDQEVAA